MTTRGFTLIEIILAMALVAIISLTLAPGMMGSVKSYELLTTRAQALNQARSAIDLMVKEIRLIPGIAQLTTTTTSNFQFQYPTGTSINYNVSGTTLMRNSDALLNNLSSITFTYYDEAGVATATKANVRSVGIGLTVDPPGSAPNLSLRTRVFLRNTGNSYPTGFAAN